MRLSTLLISPFAAFALGASASAAVVVFDNENIPKAEQEYQKLLESAGCHIIGGKKNLVKGQFSVVFRVAAGFEPEVIQKEFSNLPKEYQGAACDWDIS